MEQRRKVFRPEAAAAGEDQKKKELQPWRCRHRDWNSNWTGSVALLAKELNVKGKRTIDAQLTRIGLPPESHLFFTRK